MFLGNGSRVRKEKVREMTDTVTPVQPEAKSKRAWYKRPVGIVALTIVGIGVLANITGGSEPSAAEVQETFSEIGEGLNTDTPAVTEAPAPSMSVSQENAVEQAESYIDIMAFSREGLIEQLEFEDYSTADATFAVDHIAVNWNDEAAEQAESYLDIMAYSRQGLIEQLEFEGYTPEQAAYGASSVGL
jgi:hypothetical protein